MQLELDSSNASSTVNKLLGVSVIVPCFNEEASLDQLFEKLTAVRSMFSDKFDLEFILVDDGSSDATAAGIEKRSRSGSFVKTFSHARNRGIAAAIMTGIREASNELVATIDADCTYDPIQLGGLIEKMEDGVAMVTASPYHPLGEVEGIPGWRLGLSRACSLVYRKLVKTQIHTYTSCFRLHRRSMVLGISLREEGFVGVAEMLWHVSRRGGVIEEVPVRLTGRRVGYSKMRTLPVIFAHLKLMTRIAVDRCLHP